MRWIGPFKKKKKKKKSILRSSKLLTGLRAGKLSGKSLRQVPGAEKAHDVDADNHDEEQSII